MKRKAPERIEINKRLNKIRELLLEEEKELIQKASFVATTVSKAVMDKAIYCQGFDVVIFDEASMAYIPQIVFAGGLAKKHFLCLGDFCQLPSIVQNPIEDKLTEDIFEYTGITGAVEEGYGHEWLVMLNEQYRMHPDIAKHVGDNMYGGRLVTAEKIIADRMQIARCSPLPGEAMNLVDLSFMYSVCIRTMDGSHLNLMSGLLSMRMAELLIPYYNVAIITPYNAQSRLILAMLRDVQEIDQRFNGITCATVHQFQGSEKPIVIYDVVDCFRQPYPGNLLTSTKNNTANRLFNVALTRAQGKFILISNRDYLVRKKISKKLLFTKTFNEICNENSMISGDQILSEMSPLQNGSHYITVGDRDELWLDYLKDLKKAKQLVNIDMPGPMEDDEEKISTLITVIKELKKCGIEVNIRVEAAVEISKDMEQYICRQPYVMVPVTIIDKAVIWYGQPIMEADFITEGERLFTEYFPTIRFEGKHTARALQAFWELGK